MNGVQLRRADVEDAAGIAAVHVSAWQVAYRGLVADELLDGLSVAQREADWRGWLRDDGGASFTLVAETGDSIIGFCAVVAPSRDADAGERVSEVAAIYVQPKHWRRGVGTVLLSAASSKLRGQAWNTVTLWVLDANTQAIAFYSVHGFTPDGAKAHDDHTNLPEIRLRALLTE